MEKDYFKTNSVALLKKVLIKFYTLTLSIPIIQVVLKRLRVVLRDSLACLNKDQALYSFRHSGAIEMFKKTGALTKLQKAMGHSSINVSLTYLRGLEVAELTEEDMPMV